MRPQEQLILLKEGTEGISGTPQIISNINACQDVAEAVRTTLGPRGMDKLIVNEERSVTISNDGATIMKLLDVVHPAAKTLVDIAKSQDAEVGDGTTTVVLLAAEFLGQVKSLIEEGIHPRVIIQAFKRAADYGVEKIKSLSVKIDQFSVDRDSLFVKCAMTALSSKLIHQQKYFFAKMAVDAVSLLDRDFLLPLNMIGIKKIGGGALENSLLIRGVAFKKTFTYAGYEMQPKACSAPKIAILNVDLEMKAERENAEIRVDSVSEYQRVVDAEWEMLYSKLEMICKSGARIVLSKLSIGDVATQYFADRNMFCAGKVSDEDLKRTVRACGGCVVSTIHDLSDHVLGACERFEERQIGGERCNIFTGCPNAKACTIILRGGTEQFLEETERSLHDAIMVTRKMMLGDGSVVAGGGAIEMELSRLLGDYSKTVERKQQLAISAFAKALEVIPRQLADNAGFDAVDILSRMRQKHVEGCTWHGVDIDAEDTSDNFGKCVWEPATVKINSLTAAAEAACLVLSVDETIKNISSLSRGGGRGKGRPF